MILKSKFCELKFSLRVAFFLGTPLFLLATLSWQPRLRSYCNFLPNLENVTPFLRWNKQKCIIFVRREMHFYAIETSKVL